MVSNLLLVWAIISSSSGALFFVFGVFFDAGSIASKYVGFGWVFVCHVDGPADDDQLESAKLWGVERAELESTLLV